MGGVIRGVVSVDTEEIPIKRVSAWLGCQIHCRRPSIWIVIRGTNVVCALRDRADVRYILHCRIITTCTGSRITRANVSLSTSLIIDMCPLTRPLRKLPIKSARINSAQRVPTNICVLFKLYICYSCRTTSPPRKINWLVFIKAILRYPCDCAPKDSVTQ